MVTIADERLLALGHLRLGFLGRGETKLVEQVGLRPRTPAWMADASFLATATEPQPPFISTSRLLSTTSSHVHSARPDSSY